MSERFPKARIILLGASNLTRGIATVVGETRRRLGAPLDFMIACGHGRSYGVRSRVAFRELPGIVECALWPDLARRSPLPTYAVISDIGNDLAYGIDPKRIAAWVETCLERLRAISAKTVMLQLPTPTIGAITPAQYWLLKNVYFSQHEVDLTVVQERAKELAERIKGLASDFGAALVEQESAWYSFDPIHYPMLRWRRVWSHVIDEWRVAPVRHARLLPATSEWLYIRSRAPELRWLFGSESRKSQPVGVLRCGSALSLY